MEYKISSGTKHNILVDIIEPYYIKDVKNILNNKSCWRITSSIFETISKILLSGGAVISFASGYYQNYSLSFISGTISSISLACFQFSIYCSKECKKSTIDLNNILKKLNIEDLETNNNKSISTEVKDDN